MPDDLAAQPSNTGPLNLWENPWGGWTAAAAGLISGDFATREKALEWMASPN